MAAASFPRGKKPVAPAAPAAVGGAKARPAKKRKHAGAAEAPAEAEEAGLPDALFGKKGVAATAAASGSAKAEAKRQPKKPRVDAKSKNADGAAAAAAAAKKPASAPALTFKALKKGMLLLGCVRQVNDGYDLLVSLPNKLTGTVSLAESSDEFHAVLERQKKRKAPSNEEEDEDALPALSAVFTVGQFVPCVVLGTGKENKHKQVHLSLRMSLLHAELTPHSVAKGMALHASVASIEDHGAIMNLGVRGLNAFVPVKQLPADGVRKGQQLLVNVLSINAHTNTATVTPDRAQVVKAVTRGDSFTLKQLVPGMLLNVRVEDVLSNGLSVNFLTFFSATVEQNHMSLPCQQGWENSYRKGLKGRARIISIDAVNKQVALSMAPHVVHLQVPESQYVVGDKVEDASIERIDEGIGMLLSLKSGPAAAEGDDEDMEVDSGATKSSWKSFSPGYVHISNAADDRIDKLEKKFTVGQAVKCRVIGFAPFDGLVMVSCKQSSLNQTVLRHKDLTPGMKISGKILAMEKWGILLEISEGVRAVVPSQHVPPFVHLKKSGSKKGDSSGKYQVGRTVDARVLRVDADTKKTYLTMKKALLSSELPVLSAFENAKMGTVAHGFITKIADYGVVVTFYNNVYGLVPAAVLHQAGIENLEEAYVLGQVVKASVTRCDVTKKRLALSFSTTATKSSSSTGGSANPTEGDEVSDLIGKTVTNLKVVDVESSCFRVQTSDGLDGVLPFVQLTDFPRQTALVDEQVKKFSAGDIIDTPVLAVSQSKDGVVTFSMKPLLLEYAKKAAVVPKVFEDVKANAVLVGFVASVHATKGVFVKFLNNLVAVAPKAYLREKFLSQIEDGIFEMGETVVCSVESVDAPKKQFVVGFHRQAVFQPARLNARITPFLQAYLREASAIHEVSALLTIGKVEKAEFLGVRPYGAVFSIEKDGETATVVVPADQADDEWEEGTKIKLVATDYDFEKHIYYGSVDTALVEAGSKKVRKQRTRLTPGSKISSATVVAISSTQKYAIVSFADPTSTEVIQLGVAQLCEFWSPSQTSTELGVEVGATVNCNVLAANLKGVSGAKSSPFEDLPLLAYEVDAVLSSSKPRKKKSSGGGDEKKLPKYTAEDFVVGKLLTGSVAGVKEGSMDIRLRTSKKSGKVITSVSIADVDENPDRNTHPFDRFNIHDHVIGRIIAVVAKGAHKLKPVSEENPAVFHSLHLSLRAADVEGDKVKKATAFVRPDWTENSAGRALLTAGNSIEGVVAEHKNDHLVVKLSHRVHGHLSIVELSDDVDVVRTFREKFPVGKRIKANVLSVNESSQRVELSLIRSSPITNNDGLKSGDVVVGVISSKVSPIRPPAVMVQLAANVFGRVCITELLPPTQWKNAMHDLPQFAKGQVVRCVVLTNSGNHLDLSLRSDALENPAAYAKAATASIERKVGDLAPAIVTSTTSGGCFVRIDRDTTARVLLRELSDDFVKDPIAEFPTGRLVAGRITKKSDRGLEMSLKASVVSEDVSQLKWSDLKEGSTVKGTITKIQAYGVFVKIDKSAISGLCHISEVADERVTQPLDQIFSEGDYVKAKVLKIEDRRVSFGLKPSYFDGEESSSEEEEEDSDEENEAESSGDENEAEPMEVDEEDTKPVVKSKSIAKAVPMDVDEDESSEDDDDEADKSAPVEFTWDGFASVLDSKQSGKADESDDEETEDEDENPADSAKAGKKKPRANDEWIALREKALASNDEVPQSASDYERLLAVSPQSSFLWIQYMAFHVSLTEVALARDVAVRATSAVSFRDEKEKLNVWTAYLNLEHDFGDDASFMRVFKSALAVNHPKRVYLHLVDLYARAREIEDVETTLATMQKKFRTSKQTWLRALQFYVSESELGKAAETLQRSLQSLAAHKHLPVILKYGQLMFESGELDKARTIFEGILANYPKRVDLWSVYVDKEVKFGGDHALVRALFERLLAMDFSPKKMKFLFKKFLTFEAAHGDAARVEHVKQLAADFVATAAGKQ